MQQQHRDIKSRRSRWERNIFEFDLQVPWEIHI